MTGRPDGVPSHTAAGICAVSHSTKPSPPPHLCPPVFLLQLAQRVQDVACHVRGGGPQITHWISGGRGEEALTILRLSSLYTIPATTGAAGGAAGVGTVVVGAVPAWNPGVVVGAACDVAAAVANDCGGAELGEEAVVHRM